MAWGKPAKKEAQNAWGKRPVALTEQPEVQEEDEEIFIDLKIVKVESLTVLKLIKNSNDSNNGTLLGLDMDQCLEVTDCFAHPMDGNIPQFQNRMLNVLKDCYADNQCVGWYTISDCSPFATVEMFEEQLNYQKELDLDNTARCVLLVLDKSRISKLDFSNAIKAYRIKHELVAERKKNKTADFAGALFDEIEVEINFDEPALIQLYLETVKAELNIEDKLEDSLNLAHRSDLEKCIGRLIEEMERLEGEQSKMNYYERQLNRQVQAQEQWLKKRKAENKIRAERGEPVLPETDPLNPVFRPIPKPTKLEAALAKEQLNVYCSALNKFTSNALPKLYQSHSIDS